ncbi:uncharacterized protein EI90DRAFT_2907580, partial [Cantharellus anzutake]|uniref:uncharacterized protein n=1 Tax=Cantharellus anzutake TaxID=1750568 RepID=UPI0019089664
VARRTKRHLEELEASKPYHLSNYTEPKFSIIGEEVDADGPNTGGGSAKDRTRSTISDKKRKSSANVRRILLYRKNLSALIDEYSSLTSTSMDKPNYLNAVAAPPTTPRRPFCSICGYWGNYSCQKCGMHYCSLTCRATHDDTRCERRVL